MSNLDEYLLECLEEPYVKQFLIKNKDQVTSEMIRISREEIIKFVKYDNPSYAKRLEISRGRIYCVIKAIKLKYSDVNYKFDSSVPYLNIEGELFLKDTRREVMDCLAAIAKGEFKRGIYLYGIPGTGKTTICKHFAKKMYENGHNILFLKFPSLVMELKSKIKSNEYAYLVDIMMRTEVVIFDDFSNDAFDSTWLRNEIMFKILDYRSENNLITIFTSNFPLSEFEKEKPDMIERIRLLERIRILAKFIPLEDKSYRKY